LLISAAAFLPVNLAGALAVQIRGELSIDDTTLGLSFAAFFVCSTVTAPAAGRLVDRVGWERSARIAAGFSVLSLLGVATLGRSFAGFLSFLTIGGLGVSFATPAGNVALVELRRRRTGLLFGLKQSAIPISTLIAGLSVPAFALTVGWRWAYVCDDLVPVLAFVTGTPGGGRCVHRSQGRRGGSPGQYGEPQQQAPLLLGLLAAGGALAAVVVNSLGAFGVSTAVHSGVAAGTAGFVAAGGSVIGVGVRILAGWATDTIRIRSLTLSAAIFVGGMPGILLLSLGSPATVVAGIVVGYGIAWSWSGMMHHGVVTTFRGRPAAASGVIQMGLSVGSAGGPLLFGFLADRAGYTSAWSVIVIAACAGAAFFGAAAVRSRRAAA
jgi:MFS family permease